jgi:iron complex outermembrane receptor protein
MGLLMKNSPIIIVAVLLFLTSNLQAQSIAMISGTIQDSSGPLISANVYLVGTNRGTVSNESGKYSLVLSPGKYELRASYLGYVSQLKTITVDAGRTNELNFVLEKTSLRLNDEPVVLGSRTSRTAIETPVPIDVITSNEIVRSGQTELNQVLSMLAPSFNANPQTISDGTDHINPASLRGLGPDQVLVLINGKRRHASALLHVNGTFGRGTVGVDLNAIPLSTVERIEVLRDGASSQYGSDAIAGVINIVLKQNKDGADISTTVGVTGEGDGEQIKTSVNYGAKIGETGFINVSGEYLKRNSTNRAGTYTGSIFSSDGANDEQRLAALGMNRDDFSMKIGQSEATFGSLFFNSEIGLNDNAIFYSFGGISHRDGMGTGFYRLPYQEERVVPEFYPLGFLPEIGTLINDNSISMGIKSSKAGWDFDVSLTHGSNSFKFIIDNSNNASLGTSSPISFDAGSLIYKQTTANVDIVKPIASKFLKRLTFVSGAEFRLENFEIIAGQDESWQLGNGGTIAGVDFDTTSTGSPKAAGAQVFPGYQPSNEVDRSRNSIGIYAGFESDITKRWLVDIGGRYENYSDFGSTVIGKIATRYNIAKNFALRGAASNGFRAPSLHQLWLSNVSTQFVINPSNGQLEPKQVLTAENSNSITKSFGVPSLKEETSISFSLGFTSRPFSNLSISADVYSVSISDRIVLSSRFTDSDATVAKILEPFSKDGVSQVQFFANAVDTKTEGLDVVVTYGITIGDGLLNLTASANFTKTEVEKVNLPNEMKTIFSGGNLNDVKNTLFNREERNRLEDALPRQKASFAASYDIYKFAVKTQANYFGPVEYKPTNTANDESFSSKILFDLDIRYEIFTHVFLSIGGNNIFNTFPDKHEKQANISSGRFVYSRRVTQFGMNGGFYYSKLSVSL